MPSWRDSKPQSQQASIRRPTRYTLKYIQFKMVHTVSLFKIHALNRAFLFWFSSYELHCWHCFFSKLLIVIYLVRLFGSVARRVCKHKQRNRECYRYTTMTWAKLHPRIPVFNWQFSLFFSSLVWTLLPTHGMCCTWSHSVTHTHTEPVGLLWTSDQPDRVTSTWQHTTLTRDRYPCHRRDSNA
jgi:hypothetical protein